jgi:hypothetical protein
MYFENTILKITIRSLFGTHFCKAVSMFVKQKSRALQKRILFGTPVSILFLKTICFFFRGSHALFQNNPKLFSLFLFYLILLFTYKINIIIFFFNILHIKIHDFFFFFFLSLSLSVVG